MIAIVKRLIVALPAAAVAVGFSLFADDVGSERLQAYVEALDSDDVSHRDQAEAALLAGGKAAVDALSVVRTKGSLEQRFRATRILGRLAKSPNDATSEAARQSLEAIADGSDAALARQAKEELGPFRRLKEMQLLAKAFKVVDLSNAKQPKEIALIERPLLRFQDQERIHYDGTLWALGSPGRPLAFLCLYSRVEPGAAAANWASDAVTVSVAPLRAEAVDGVEGMNWTPTKAANEFALFPGAPAAATDPDERLAQAQKLVARLSAREAWPPSAPPQALTLSTEPLLRYADPNAGIADGLVYAFMHETNPEILVLIEAQRKGKALTWNYQLARQAAASLWVDLDNQELWVSPSPVDYQSGGDMPYWNFRRQLAQ